MKNEISDSQEPGIAVLRTLSSGAFFVKLFP